MKILLITPSNLANDKTLGFISAGIPLGLSYLASTLLENDFDVEILDALTLGFKGHHEENADYVRISKGYCKKTSLEPPFPPEFFTVGLSFKDIIEHVREATPDIVGISSIFTSIYPVAREIARRIKAVAPSITVVMGGNHPTIATNEVLSDNFVDYVMLGEGEFSFVQLAKAIESGKLDDIPKINGIGYRRDNGEIAVNPFELIKDLDAIPFPSLHLLPMDKYFEICAEGRTIKMMTSRGCTFNCYFCGVPYSSKRRFRARSPENVISEIDFLVKEYSIEGIMFEDDNMTLNVNRAKRIFEYITQRDYNLKLFARNFRADLFDLEMATLMKKTGFETIWITPESGNKRILEVLIGKKFSVEDVKETVRLLTSVGLKIAAAFVIGIPGETSGELQDTIDFARKLKDMGVGEFWFSIAQPIIGTRLYRDALEKGLISEVDPFKFSYIEGSINTDHFKAAELNRIRESVMNELNVY